MVQMEASFQGMSFLQLPKQTIYHMGINKIIGIVLIVASLALGYTGFNKVSNNDASFKVLGLKIDASNESGKNQGYLFLGVAAVVFIGGIVSVNKKAS